MCNPINPMCDIGTVLGKVGSAVAGSVFDEIATAFASAATQVTDWMWTVIAKTTTVDLSGDWFRTTFGVTVTLAGLVIAALFVLELLKAVLRREPGALAHAAIGLGTGILGAAASIGVVTALLRATDALSDGVVRTVGLASIDNLGREIAPTATLASIGSPALMLILAIGYLLASFLVWAMFIFRKAMLIVAAVFAPIAFAGAPMRATSAWVRRWVEFTLTMIFSKLLVVILFTLAISLVGSPGQGFAAVGNLFSGLALLVIACFAPWLLFRLVHFVGGDVIAAHHSVIAQSAMHAGSTPVSMARRGAMAVSSLVGGGSGAATGGRLAIGTSGSGTSGGSTLTASGGGSGIPVSGRHSLERGPGVTVEASHRPWQHASGEEGAPGYSKAAGPRDGGSAGPEGPRPPGHPPADPRPTTRKRVDE